jgi:hypothetical protein
MPLNAMNLAFRYDVPSTCALYWNIAVITGEISDMHFRKDNFPRMGKSTIELIICVYIMSNVI